MMMLAALDVTSGDHCRSVPYSAVNGMGGLDIFCNIAGLLEEMAQTNDILENIFLASEEASFPNSAILLADGGSAAG